mgnify:CR=1 FL=1|tara:strand:+ start:74 stop:298 length:225 start_codon:yes stop_codon:yes gene_type:complete
MKESISIASPPNLIIPKRAPAYELAHEVQLRANVASKDETLENKIALKRLDHAVNSEQTPRSDVPRGYYLDINI